MARLRNIFAVILWFFWHASLTYAGGVSNVNNPPSTGLSTGAVVAAAPSAAPTESYLMGYNIPSSGFTRLSLGSNGILLDGVSNNAAVISTNVTTTVKGTGGVLNGVITSTAGSAWVAAFYNIASGGCTGTPGSGYQFTLSENTVGQVQIINHTFSLGICVVTSGTTPGAFSVLYR
ncbi:MAG: hypothetical protein EO766_16665 [Hydrotalea sp. AMD]|uniref:hypothetical protein n=1 Tax=Hydrotalea sp. AMD TaxID=2501297 RepID=UPI0010258E0D|nr:hypothetical protein [Hydrotalea sp. AMD]RWZ85544.1 MAG: hypothetical protein EO766_16665 [Hydrotalea sp. AMD]